jgi:SRSO17 transposase
VSRYTQGGALQRCAQELQALCERLARRLGRVESAAGRIENCQVGVYLADASRRGHALIDRELYLPDGWLGDRVRCREAAIPDGLGFRTKPALARVMLERALEAELPGWLGHRRRALRR